MWDWNQKYDFYINFILRYKVELSLQTLGRVGPKSNLEVSDGHHTKRLWQQNKTEAKYLDQLAIKMLSLDYSKYYLSVMKSNS